MKRLIDHYIAQKTMFSPLPTGLADKMARLERALLSLGEDATGAEIAAAIRDHWPDAKDGTIRRYLVQTRAVLRMAEADGLIRKAPRIQMPYVHDAVDVGITTMDVVSLLRWVRFNAPEWYSLTTLLCHTGARLGEVLMLAPSSFKPNGIVIRKPVDRRSKTITRLIPYTPRTAEIARCVWEMDARVVSESGALRLAPAGVQHQSVSTVLGRVIDRAVAELGLGPLRVHDLRHAMAVMIAEAGGDLSDIASVLGHSSTQMSARYRGFVPARASSIMQALT